MCQPNDARVAEVRPREISGEAVDPITLAEVDEVRITTLVDNVFDGLLLSDERVRRVSLSSGPVEAPQFVNGSTTSGMRAEHGYSAWLSVRTGAVTSRIMFDTGMTPEAMLANADRLEVDFDSISAVVLSHGHFDHAGGLAGLAGRLGERRMPMIVHPQVWTRRRLRLPGSDFELPTLSKDALRGEGFQIIERRVPSLLLDGQLLVTGEVDRTTEFERGMPAAHQAWTGEQWRHDPTVIDDQALVINVRGRGLVVVTGCGHAGVVNIVRYAQRLTGVDRICAILGGFHLGGPAFEPVIAPTVDAMRAWRPDLIVPGHCTGWRAQHALAAHLPDAFLPGSSGSTYLLPAA